MKIRVDTITPEGLVIEGNIKPDSIGLDLKGEGIVFSDSIKVSAKAVKLKNEVLVDVNIEAKCEYTCARCLARIQDVLKKNFSLNYEAKPGSVLELDDDIRQETILGCPLKTLCKDDCLGLCPNCGQNLNVDKCNCG